VADDGLVLTTLSGMRDASGISVSAFGGSRTFSDVAVIATDENRDLPCCECPPSRPDRRWRMASPRAITSGRTSSLIEDGGSGH